MKNRLLIKIFVVFISVFVLISFSFSEKKEKEKEKKGETLTEEIVVTAKKPKNLPISKVSIIEPRKLEEFAAKDLSDVMNYVPGVYVSEGNKRSANINIRGLQSKRITLLYDGIPVYEPYFNSFDLNTLTANDVESIKIVKGASSVLYGPNTLGGVINIITKRPKSNSFTLDSQAAGNNTYYLAGSGSYIWDNFSFWGNVSIDKSDGFDWLSDDEKQLRENSDYERQNLVSKLYYYPNSSSEILAEFSYVNSEYGIPAATNYYRQRHWRFADWERWQFNLGGTFAVFNNGNLKVRNYYVRHYNVLNAYSDDKYSNTRWESTYKNYSFGTFVFGTIPVNEKNDFKFSLNAKKDNVNTQDDVSAEWEEVYHNTYSLGVEDHFQVTDTVKLIGGVSIDYLDKQFGDNKTSLNPIIGAKFNPEQWFDVYVSYSRKARFPSMKSLYSTSSGNPNLTEEIGNNLELGFTYDKDVYLSGAIFHNKIKDMINSVRLPSGYSSYKNIGEATISGFELEFSKKLSFINTSLNYTYMSTENKDTGEPLDYTPESLFNFFLNTDEIKGFTFSCWGIYASDSQTVFKNGIIKIPSYFLLNARIQKQFGNFILYIKANNLFNNDYFTEPGFPMKARTITGGFKIRVGE